MVEMGLHPERYVHRLGIIIYANILLQYIILAIKILATKSYYYRIITL